MKRIISFFSLLFISMSAYAQEDKTCLMRPIKVEETRVAIDFGSGALKYQAARINRRDNTIVGEPLCTDYIPLNLTEDVSLHDGYISNEMKEKALNYLYECKQKAIAAALAHNLPQPRFNAIATAVFRKAKNGAEVLADFEKQLGFKFTILSQDDEGKLGYFTAKALFPKIGQENLLVWDSGNGSFQLTSKDDQGYCVFQGPLGHGNVRLILAEEIRGQKPFKASESGCPISKEEAALLSEKIAILIPDPSASLQSRLCDKGLFVATFGEGESIFYLAYKALALTDDVINYNQAKALLDTLYDKDDAFFKASQLHPKTVTALVLLTTVMEHFGIEKIHYKKALGNTSGLLIYNDLWD